MKPETVIGWHRAGFRLYWRWRSRPRGGRPKITNEIRALIRRMAEENAGWGAPKIRGELLTLGFEVSERTVARYLRRILRRGDPGKRWLAFLQNHREVIVANVPQHPTAEWVLQQLREAFPETAPYRCTIPHHVIALDEQHLRRLIRDYVRYHYEDRLHDSLEKDTPDRRPVEHQPAGKAVVVSMPRRGGLHHRYSWREAA